MADSTGESRVSSRANNRRFKDKISKQWALFCGDCSPAMRYIASRSYKSGWAPVKFLDALFRGYGQVVFANNPISGILIFIGLFVADPVASGAGLLTACVGLLTSIALIPQSEEAIISGLTVFNPLLIGLVTAGALPLHYGIELEYWHFFAMMLAAVASVYVASAFGNILGSISRYPLPYLTMPFNVVQQLLFVVLVTVNTSAFVTKDAPTSMEPDVLNHNIIHVTSQPIPLVPSSLVSIERMVQTPEVTSEFHREWSTLMEVNSNTTVTAKFNSETYGAGIDSVKPQTIFSENKAPSIFPTENILYLVPSSDVDFDKDISSNGTFIEHPKFGSSSKNFTVGVRNGLERNATDESNSTVKEVLESGITPEIVSSTTERLSFNSSIETLESEGTPKADLSTTEQPSFNSSASALEADVNPRINSSTVEQFSNNSSVDEGFTDSISEDNTILRERTRRNVLLENELHDTEYVHNKSTDNAVQYVELDWGGVFSGIVLSMSQVYAFNDAPASVLIYLAVMIYSPITAGFAFVGAFVGTITGVFLSDAETYAMAGGIYDGTWGFNGVLCTMSLGGLFLVLNWPSAIAAVICSLFATCLYSALLSPFAQGDLAPMSLPFNLSALMFLCALSSGSLVRPKVISFPEKHRQEYKIVRNTKMAHEQVCLSGEVFEKEELEKKPAMSEVV